MFLRFCSAKNFCASNSRNLLNCVGHIRKDRDKHIFKDMLSLKMSRLFFDVTNRHVAKTDKFLNIGVLLGKKNFALARRNLSNARSGPGKGIWVLRGMYLKEQRFWKVPLSSYFWSTRVWNRFHFSSTCSFLRAYSSPRKKLTLDLLHNSKAAVLAVPKQLSFLLFVLLSSLSQYFSSGEFLFQPGQIIFYIRKVFLNISFRCCIQDIAVPEKVSCNSRSVRR